MSSQIESESAQCPICSKQFKSSDIETHVNRCIFLNSSETNENNKRQYNIFDRSPVTSKKLRLDVKKNFVKGNVIKKDSVLGRIDSSPKVSNEVIHLSDVEDDKNEPSTSKAVSSSDTKKQKECVKSTCEKPLAEKMRPQNIDEYVGQDHIISKNTVIRSVLDSNEIPSMIFWGPPGCGKTTLAHIIANRCKMEENSRFVKVSATMVGVNDIKEIIKVAKNELKFKRKTILFMDEIHRFNKLQQDTFLPHVESGTIVLIGATTENPSFSLNSALLSRCRVIVLEKLETKNLVKILSRALKAFDGICIDEENMELPDVKLLDFIPKIVICKDSLIWLAEMCDGDARIALNSLQLAMQSLEQMTSSSLNKNGLQIISLDAIKEGIKKSHLLYDRKGDQHFDCISALHKSIRASDDNASLYWCTRMMESGEDPKYICRRLVRAASEDIGLADPLALSISLAAMQSVQLIGMPEADCIIAQCAVYLARAPKCTHVYRALGKCKQDIKQWKGPLPAVPLHLRNAPTKLMKDLGYGKDYNKTHKDESGLNYMPNGMEETNYFSD